MKNLSLFVSAVALLSASSAFAAINCATLPTCESLGYSDTVAQCPNKSIKCPFDTTKGTCLHEAAVGEIAYFSKAPTGSGWLLCNGQTITKAKYPDLYAFLEQQFCTADHGGTCGTDVGRVPDYRGYFLRVYAQGSYGSYVSSTFSSYANVVNSSLTAPQKQGLPNITATWYSAFEDKNAGGTACSGAISCKQNDVSTTYKLEIPKEAAEGYIQRSFDASKTSIVYGSSTGVTPPNYAVYAYIYAGRVVK